jgi:hypothetical protein
MIWIIATVELLGVACVTVGCPASRRGRGRHISKPLGRVLGWSRRRVWSTQPLLLVASSAFAFAGVLWPSVGTMFGFIAWVVDDWITGDDDKPRRKRARAKVKLRMPKPIKLRAAERFPAPVLT